MSADIERESFDPKFHFSRLIYHQGSVLLASDLNEHGAIFQYYLRQFIIDFVGKHWRTPDSFEISAVGSNNFKISKGHFYVDGILCVNEADCWYAKEDEVNGVKKQSQPYLPTPELADNDLVLSPGFAVYLECWERHVNSIQRPDISEVALGGLDTSSRMEIAWQVRVLTPNLAIKYIDAINGALAKKTPTPDPTNINNIWEAFNKLFDQTTIPPPEKYCDGTQKLIDIFDDAEPRLRVWAKKPADATDPCSISPDARYRGLENQLYRLEIHTPGVPGINSNDPKPSFKWSRENGSVVFKILSVNPNLNSSELTVEIETLGRDQRYGVCVNDWLELTSDEIEFGQKMLPLAKVTKIDPTLGRLTLNTKNKTDFTGCTLLRRWDQKDGSINNSGTIDITEAKDDNDNNYDSWIPLECGIKIQFQSGGNYRKGDYWLIPARVASGDVEWPKKKDDKGNYVKDNKGNYVPDARPTDGIKRHRAALSVFNNSGVILSSCGCIQNPICPENL